MEKNTVEVVMNNKGEVIEKVADYIGVASFAKTIEELYRECLDEFDDAEDLEEYIADMLRENIQSLAWEFTSGTIPNTDTIEVCLVVAAAKLTLKMQRML